MRSAFYRAAAVLIFFSWCVVLSGCCKGDGGETKASFPAEPSLERAFEAETGDIYETTEEAEENPTEKSAMAASLSGQGKSAGELVELYNRALEKAELNRTRMSRKTEKGLIDLGVKTIDLGEGENAGLKAVTETSDSKKTAGDVRKLETANVEKAEISGSDVIFHLKIHWEGTDISQGAGGYLGIAEKETTAEILKGAAGYLGLPGTVTVKSGEYFLYGGEITASFSEDFTALKKVSFRGKEKVSGKVQYLVMEVPIEMEFALSSVYES